MRNHLSRPLRTPRVSSNTDGRFSSVESHGDPTPQGDKPRLGKMPRSFQPLNKIKATTSKLIRRNRGSKDEHRVGSLDQGLALLNERLGTRNPAHEPRTATYVTVRPTAHLPRNIYYAPDMDGNAEPGEVVWVTVPSHPPRQRSMLVVGRERGEVLGLLISSEAEHASDERWLGIGAGEWNASGKPCWVRLDKTMIVPEIDLHRSGTIIPQRRFERVANRLRDRFDWE